MGIRTAHKYSQWVNFGGAFLLHNTFLLQQIFKKMTYVPDIKSDLDSIFKTLYIEFCIKIISIDPIRNENIYLFS
jgi:hypothetical protein